MNNKSVLDFYYKVIMNLDKSVRILGTGFIILVIFFWKTDFESTLNAVKEINFIYFLSFITLSGIVFYSIHRTLFSVIDFFLIKKCNEKLMDLNINSFTIKMPDQLQRIFYIFNAGLHLSAIFCELVILSYIFKNVSQCDFKLCLTIIFFVLILIIKIFETRLEFNIKVKKYREREYTDCDY